MAQESEQLVRERFYEQYPPGFSVKKDLIWQAIRKQYNEPHRHYHNFDHLAAGIVVLDTIAVAERMDDEVIFAWLMHDFFYYIGVPLGTNEELSAMVAQKFAREIGFAFDLAMVSWINATMNHLMPQHERYPGPCARLLDADLSILGTDSLQYNRYVTAIRAEYNVEADDPRWKQLRGIWIKSMLDREFIYHTNAARQMFENIARYNLDTELRRLEGDLQL